MSFIKEYKSIICILLIAVLLFAFSTVVTSAAISESDMEGFDNLRKDNNTTTNNDIEVPDKSENNTTANNIINNDISTGNNIATGNNTNIKKEQTNTSNNELAKAGLEDHPSIILITVLAIASVYGYIKVKKYNNI